MNLNWSYSPETSNLGQNRRFFIPVTLKFDKWPWKTIGHLFFTTLSFVHPFKAMSKFNLELQSGNSQFGSKSVIFCPVRPWNLTEVGSWPLCPRPLTLTFFIDITPVNGNNSWKFRDDTMQEHGEKGVTERQTYGQTDRQKDGLKCY